MFCACKHCSERSRKEEGSISLPYEVPMRATSWTKVRSDSLVCRLSCTLMCFSVSIKRLHNFTLSSTLYTTFSHTLSSSHKHLPWSANRSAVWCCESSRWIKHKKDRVAALASHGKLQSVIRIKQNTYSRLERTEAHCSCVQDTEHPKNENTWDFFRLYCLKLSDFVGFVMPTSYLIQNDIYFNLNFRLCSYIFLFLRSSKTRTALDSPINI